MSKMMLYLWEDTDSSNEIKFGEHFTAADDPEQDTADYIRGSLGRQKYKFDEGTVKIHRIWDATKYAKSVNLLKKHSKLDDKIRNQIDVLRQSRVNKRSEFHRLDATAAILAVTDFLTSYDNPLVEAELSTAQHEVLEEVIEKFEGGDKIILAELCARFGKTIWSGAVAVEMETELVVVASYVQTVFNSFSTDLSRFEQFKDYVHVDMKSDDYDEQIDLAYARGKKVIAYLSLCQSRKRQDKIDYLFGINKSRMLIVDEADLGAHQIGQAKPLIDAKKIDDMVLVMTGTNADRASKFWEIDHIIPITYSDLLVNKYDAMHI
jgi:hypothetical protein